MISRTRRNTTNHPGHQLNSSRNQWKQFPSATHQWPAKASFISSWKKEWGGTFCASETDRITVSVDTAGKGGGAQLGSCRLLWTLGRWKDERTLAGESLALTTPTNAWSYLPPFLSVDRPTSCQSDVQLFCWVVSSASRPSPFLPGSHWAQWSDVSVAACSVHRFLMIPTTGFCDFARLGCVWATFGWSDRHLVFVIDTSNRDRPCRYLGRLPATKPIGRCSPLTATVAFRYNFKMAYSQFPINLMVSGKWPRRPSAEREFRFNSNDLTTAEHICWSLCWSVWLLGSRFINTRWRHR